jgi:hypothetical protein
MGLAWLCYNQGQIIKSAVAEIDLYHWVKPGIAKKAPPAVLVF